MFKKSWHTLQKLQWKLTLSYTLVAVLTIFILGMAMIIITNTQNYHTPQYGILFTMALSDASEDIIQPMMLHDQIALQQWLDKTFVYNSVLLGANQDKEQDRLVFVGFVSPDTLSLILDKDGMVLASNHPDSAPVGSDSSSLLSDEEQSLMKETFFNKKHWKLTEQSILAAVPVTDQDGIVIGVIYSRLIFAGFWDLFFTGLLSMVPVSLLIGLGTTIISTFFGALTARGFVRRLKRLSDVTAAWSKGDFSLRAHDLSKDEIGQLGRDIDRTAAELKRLMELKQNLAIADERNRMARDLHDSVKQQVFAGNMHLAAAKALVRQNPEEAEKHLETAFELSHQAQQELSTIIQTLRPLLLQEKGLKIALEELLIGWEKQNNIFIEYEFKCQTEKCSPNIEEVLYRVCQEALANIAKHSGATQGGVQLIFANRNVLLEIKDNGHGFNTHQTARGLGLRSMSERVAAAGGRFNIKSSSLGTIIRVEFQEADLE